MRRIEASLQDFMDVEYIPLEAKDEFITQGKVMAIGAEVILITNWANDGNLFVFDRKTGKGLKKIMKEIAAKLDEESSPVIC